MQIIPRIIEKHIFLSFRHMSFECARACECRTSKVSNNMGFSYVPTEYMNTLSCTCCFFNLPFFFLDTNERLATSRNISQILSTRATIAYISRKGLFLLSSALQEGAR